MTASRFRRFSRRGGVFLNCVLLLGSAVWASFALWFQLPLSGGLKLAGIALFDGLAALTLAGVFWRPLRGAWIAYALVFAGLLGWWSTILPSNDRDFAPDVAHGVTGIVRGDELTLENVRNFTWASPTDFSEHWEERRYDLAKLSSVDFYLVYFMGPLIAHSMVSFGFEDGRHLMFSIEIRKERGEAFSAIAGFFKRYELVFLAADERDFLFLRKAEDEDVRLFRIRTSPQAARALLLQYVRDANQLAAHPQFYNTLTANCTTSIFLMLRTLSPTFPLDWRVLLNGFLPSYAYQHGLIDTSIPLAEVIARAAVTDRIMMGLSEVAFGQRLREGLPDPN
ncbi:DUF4105 domain-containing protein [Methylocella tundrae]|uniref:Lnb N-terminal periplasmic domain-containing protein n=1 Tax=Methylocella tundrae TaxID=227605 RepID=A0A4U8Z3K0_METTU|nr:DUF4105 domain-containing protein [Methylocella tundrae]WPP03793.1 DUF4105 domain-containing protein [Methylocella tundrae]VFU09956.1 conserved membrane protein of unknown function [Methylocella tundrae]